MKKKLLTFGTILAASPISLVISCGINRYATSDEQKLYHELTSDTGLRILENQWQYKVLTNAQGQNLIKSYSVTKVEDGKTKTVQVTSPNLDNPIVIKIATALIQNSINGDKTGKYLTNLTQSFISSGASKNANEVPGMVYNASTQASYNVYSLSWLAKQGLMSHIFFANDLKFNFDKTYVPKTDDTLTYNALALLTSDDRLTFKTDLLKSLVTYTYLTTINKDQWAAVNPKANRELNTIDANIDPAEFPLVKEAISKKYFADWKLQLSSDDSQDFYDQFKDGITPKDALANMNIANQKNDAFLVSDAKYSETQTRSTDNIYNLGNIAGTSNSFTNIVNFQGIKSQAAGPDALRFTLSSLEGAADDGYYQGFLISNQSSGNNRFIKYDDTSATKSVKVFPQKGDQASLELLRGIVPIYDKIKGILTFADKSTNAEFFAAFDKDLYTEAKKYYVTQVGKKGTTGSKDAIILEFKKDSPVQKYKKILEDKFNIDFLDPKNPE